MLPSTPHGRRSGRFVLAGLRRSALVAAGVLLLAALPAHASSTKFFRATTQADFLRGELDNLSVDSRGQLMLGPKIDVVYETSAPFLWTMVGDSDGTLYVGLGNEGNVFKVDAEGRGSLFFHSPELEVHALALAPGGALYVATSPDGRIYRVDRDGRSSTFFDPDDKYIWSLVVDASGTVYAATGDRGAIYKIAPDGKGALFYKANATHVTALALDGAGNLLVGTGSPGKVLRISPDGRAFVLLDARLQEIHALRFDARGMLYAMAFNGRPSGGAPSADTGAASPVGDAPRPVVTTEVSAAVEAPAGGQGVSARDSRRGLTGAIFRIAPDGVWDEVWQSREDSPYDLAFEPDGALLLGTGNKGKIYRLDGEPLQSTLLTRAGGQQVTAFFKGAGGRLFYATANPGKIYRVSADRSPRGSYESEPRDAQTVSAWGTISWRGTADATSRIELFTRSGNTETPDETWSPWSAAYRTRDGSAITSPKARYLQWRADLTGTDSGPVLTSVTAAYLQRNLRPQVTTVTVYPQGVVFQRTFGTDPELAGLENQATPDRRVAATATAPPGQAPQQALGRRIYQRGLRTLSWRATDENDDDLVYDVLYRREGDAAWTPLRRGTTDTIVAWDTTTLATGTYFVKVVASDAPSNPTGSALAGERESPAFEIDNTPPTIVVTSLSAVGGRTVVVFDVTDDHSPIQRVEYSVDGVRWRAAFPDDGIADSREEHYRVTIDRPLNERGLSLRATDALDNVATAHIDPPSVTR